MDPSGLTNKQWWWW